jgi:hypothetical protein
MPADLSAVGEFVTLPACVELIGVPASYGERGLREVLEELLASSLFVLNWWRQR